MALIDSYALGPAWSVVAPLVGLRRAPVDGLVVGLVIVLDGVLGPGRQPPKRLAIHCLDEELDLRERGEGRREGGREGEREGGREEGRERKGGREGEEGREGGRDTTEG